MRHEARFACMISPLRSVDDAMTNATMARALMACSAVVNAAQRRSHCVMRCRA
jgi:hypothetical protein